MSEEEAASVDTELEKYRIRYGFYKVLFGTAIVGLAGVLIPGAVEFWQLLFEDRRKTAEIELAQVNHQQDYVKDFLQTAINQDIELRIRFANYFSHVAASPFTEDWIEFRDSLIQTRDTNRREIHKQELAIRKALAEENPDIDKQAHIAQLERELEWRYREVGYVPKNRSVVRSKSEELDPVPAQYSHTFAMPNIIGLTLPEAKRRVLSAGRRAGATSVMGSVVDRRSTNRPNGHIIQQMEAPGKQMRPYMDDVGGVYGQVTFRVVVSAGPEE